MIDGVIVKKLNVIPDERGRLTEVLRVDDEFFTKFGQVYITSCYPGVVKGWHYHKIQVDYIACIHGMIKLVLYDNRDESWTKGETNEFFMGIHNPLLVKVPIGVLHGFKGISENEALILNCPTEPYNYKTPDEYRIAPHGEIPYDWNKVDK